MTRKLTLLLGAALLLSAAVAVGQAPILTVDEPGFGTWIFEGLGEPPVTLEVPNSTPLNFSWLGDVSHYGGTIDGYRYGWDVVDPDDDLDPGWVPFAPDLLGAPEQIFSAGTHTFHVEVRDILGAETRAGFVLEIQTVVPEDQLTWGAVKVLFRE